MIFQSLLSHLVLVLLSLSTVIDNTGSISTSRNTLLVQDTGGCVCPGDILSYECRVASESGVGSTVWRGSALASRCTETGGEIVLRHRTFIHTRTCGNSITGQGIGIEGNSCYTSRLNITVDFSLDNKSVECVYNNGTTSTVIGSSNIEIMKDAYPPPNDIRVTQLNVPYSDHSTLEVTLVWSPVVTADCSTQYYIISSDCGLCPNTSTTDITTTITCSAWSPMMEGEYCTFEVSIGTNICNDSLIGTSRTIGLTLKAPDVPFVEVIPLYSYETDKLSVITTIFSNHNMINDSELVYDTKVVNIPVINYTIEYYFLSRSISLIDIHGQDQRFCNDSKGIQLCKHEYDIMSTFQQIESACDYQTNNVIIVSVSATNVFGHGPAINTSIGCKNTFVMAIFHPNYTGVTCKFLALRSLDNMLQCSITYGNGAYKQQNTTGPGVADTVVVTINTTRVHQLPINDRQFIIIATDGTSTAKIEGKLNVTEGGSTLDTENVNIIILLSIFAAITITVIIALLSVIFVVVLIRSKKKSKNELSSVSEPPAIDTKRNVAYEVIQL